MSMRGSAQSGGHVGGPHVCIVTQNPVRVGGMQKFSQFLVRSALTAGWRVTVALSGEDIYSDQPSGGRLRVEHVDWLGEHMAGDREYVPSRVLARWRWFRRLRPDVAVFVQSSNTPLRASVLGAWLAGVPVVTTHRTMPYVMPKTESREYLGGLVRGIGLHRRLSIARTRLTALLARRVVCNSRAVADAYALDYSYPRSRLVVIPNAVETCGARAVRWRADGDMVIGFVGRIGREKRLDVLLRAVAMMRECGVRVRIWGEGPESAALEGLAKELGIASRVSWCGVTDDPAGALAQTDVVVLCSPRESSSNMVLEAMAAGRAVVVTNVGGGPELVDGGRCGVIVPPGDAAALAGALDELAGDPARREQLGGRALRRVRAAHAADEIAARWMTLLDSVVRRPATKRRAVTDPRTVAVHEAGGVLA